MANMLSERAVREIHALRNQFEDFLMNDETGERAREARKFLSLRPCWLPKGASTASPSVCEGMADYILEGDEVALEAYTARSLQQVLRPRHRVCITRSFSKVMEYAVPVDLPDRKIGVRDFPKGVQGEEVTRALPEGYAFSEYEMCAALMQLVTPDVPGRVPLGSHMWNLFYSAHFRMAVSVNSNEVRWYATLRPRDETWIPPHKEVRVFFRK